MKGQIWETKPLEFWGKAKEMRAKWEKSIDDKEMVLGQGQGEWPRAFPALTIIEDNPAGSTIAHRDPEFARKARLASEVRGWGKEICGYHGVLWGTQFLGYQADGSPFTQRQLVVPIPCVCDCHTKRGIQARDFEPVPMWMQDHTMYLGDYDPAREVEMIEHRLYNQLRIVNDIERIFGQQFDEEKMYEIRRASSKVSEYMSETYFMMSNIPAPLSIKDIYSFFQLGALVKFGPSETEELWKMIRDEVKWRVDNKIAGVPTERFRWMEAHPPSWHFLKYYRYMEQYGAVCIGSQYTSNCARQLEIKSDGTRGTRSYVFQPRDIPLETREDLFRSSTALDSRLPYHFKQDEYVRPYALNEFAEYYHCDGALFGVHRSGVGCTMTRKEQAMRLREAGYSVMCYEMSQSGDPTDLDEKRMLEQLDSWMEVNGLRKLD
jgi:benzoyl-CoA reductase subunit B